MAWGAILTRRHAGFRDDLQRLTRIQGHSMRVLDTMYSELLEEFEDAEQAIEEIRMAR